MSTAELQRFIDARTPEELAFIGDYLRYLRRPPAKVIKVNHARVAKLQKAAAEIEAGRNCVTMTGEALMARLADPARVPRRRKVPA